MTGFRFAPAAERDLEQILDQFDREGGREVADRVLLRFFDAAAKLAEMPRMGRPWTGRVGRDLRAWVVYRSVLVYAPDTDPLEIIRIFHGARDPGWIAGGMRATRDDVRTNVAAVVSPVAGSSRPAGFERLCCYTI